MNRYIKTPSQRTIILEENHSLIMGILNFTPDSFSENGEFFNPEKAYNHCQKLIDEGVDIIDLGLESTRPYAVKVSEEEELRRINEVFPMIRRICMHNTLLSVDTYKPSVAEYAIKNGADIINCVFGGAFEENIEQVEIYKVVAKYNCPIIIMHNKPVKNIAEIISDLESMANLAIKTGVKKENIILDYGFGFNKNMKQNLDMQREIEQFKTLGYPLLVGVSRKSTLREILTYNGGSLDDNSLEESLLTISEQSRVSRADLDDATMAFYAHCLTKKSVSIFRTHNVKKAKICRDCIERINEPEKKISYERM